MEDSGLFGLNSIVCCVTLGKTFFSMKKSRTIGIISAVPVEGNSIARRLRSTAEKNTGGLSWQIGMLGGAEIVSVVSGVGKTNAAHAVTVLIKNYHPALIVNFGIGGAYPSSKLKTGDIAVAAGEVYADEGVLLRNGFHTLEYIDIPLLKKGRRKYFNQFPADTGAGLLMVDAAAASGFRALQGTFATVSACTGTRQQAEELSKRFGAICENMEGAAIAHICLIYGVPFAEVRGISNMADDRDTSKWEIRRASANCQKTVMEFVARY